MKRPKTKFIINKTVDLQQITLVNEVSMADAFQRE